MANQHHLDILKQGAGTWNQWRLEGDNRLIRPDLSEVDLHGIDVSGADLFWANCFRTNFSNANLNGVVLGGANLDFTNFNNANLNKAFLRESYLALANFNGASLKGAELFGSYLASADFSHADLTEANLGRAMLYNANFSHAILTKAILGQANLIGTNFSEANLVSADMRGAILNNVTFKRANLTESLIYGSSVWNVDMEEAIQTNLVITSENEATITVDNLEVAQFIYLLLNHKKLRDVLNSVMERGILLLGRFTDGGLEVLQAIAAKLREMKYLPITFDFPRPDSRNLTETVMTLVGLSRFVIVDLSGRSVANELRSTVPHFKIPFVPIIEESRKKDIYSMFSDFLEDDWVLPLVVFTSKEHLMELLPSRIIKPAEERFEDRRALLEQLFQP